METTYIECQCSSLNHVVRLTLDPQDGELYVEVHLNHCDPWWRRVWNALKYVFGRKVQDGHYDCTILRVEDYDVVRDMLRKSEIAKAAAHSRSREQRSKGE
jgi:hypothetical protein